MGEEERHINSAFYIFRVTEENVVLPKLIADTEVWVWRRGFQLPLSYSFRLNSRPPVANIRTSPQIARLHAKEVSM